MDKIFAIISSHDNGYPVDREAVKKLGPVGSKFELKDAHVGTWMTDIVLEGQSGSYNSVNFEFVDEDDKTVDIYKLKRFQQYSVP